jgi:hypothetical protein
MRTATIILGTLILLATAGMGVLGTKKSLSDAKDVSALINSAGDGAAKELKAHGYDPGRMKTGGIALAVAGLLSLALIGGMFTNKAVPHVAIGLLVVAIAAIVIAPQYETGATGGLSAKTFGYIVAVMGALGAAAAYGSKVLKDKQG